MENSNGSPEEHQNTKKALLMISIKSWKKLMSL